MENVLSQSRLVMKIGIAFETETESLCSCELCLLKCPKYVVTFICKISSTHMCLHVHNWSTSLISYYAPAQVALSNDAVWRLSRTFSRRAAGRLDGVYGWLGLAWLAWLKAAAAGFHCRPGRGHIMAAAHLQLVFCLSSCIMNMFIRNRCRQ